MVGLLSRTLVLTSVGTVALLLPANLRACEFCGLSGQTLTSQVAQAGTVLYGTLSDADQDKGETVMNVEKVVKKHKDLGDETKVTLARFIPIEKDPKYKDLVSMTDSFPDNPGEKLGSLVEANVGKGRWLYVGLALWRQLPAGTDGAYQLLANLISLGKTPPAPATVGSK